MTQPTNTLDTILKALQTKEKIQDNLNNDMTLVLEGLKTKGRIPPNTLFFHYLNMKTLDTSKSQISFEFSSLSERREKMKTFASSQASLLKTKGALYQVTLFSDSTVHLIPPELIHNTVSDINLLKKQAKKFSCLTGITRNFSSLTESILYPYEIEQGKVVLLEKQRDLINDKEAPKESHMLEEFYWEYFNKASAELRTYLK